MAYRIPTAEVLAVAIVDVLRENPTVDSQKQLTELVRERLHCIDPAYAVTGQRIRRTAISSGLVRVEVQTRDSGKRRRLTRCPVCDSKLSKVRNRTISGDITIIGRRCPNCSYHMGLTERIPTRYVFSNIHSRRRSPADNGQTKL